MALLKRLYKTPATKKHEAYQKHVRETKAKGRKPLSFRLWAGSRPSPQLKRRRKTPVEKPKGRPISLLIDYARRTGKPKRKK